MKLADFGKKRSGKVDYAIFKDGSPIIFVEAKSVNKKLSNHDAQLCRYFNDVTEVRIAIITNGTEYKFFTDLTADNVMDETPFLIVNLLNLKESDFETLLRFKKESFDKEFLVRYAEELFYTPTLDNSLKELLKQVRIN
ncbi:type I restriction enzyme HsdR N-terminal domain-containing protein [Clostridium estertheticum]|nr:type I restriction enzyme HsdR N-terminal domain-containing protein [Clostridium estertheticum]WLC77355.1 type I restriction enzyme HsdR N-terminal domain-containing protein [Clostridium estertheticum]